MTVFGLFTAARNSASSGWRPPWSLADPTLGLEDLQNAVERFAVLSSGEVDRVEQVEEWPIGRRLLVTSLGARLALMSKAGSAAMPGPASGKRRRTLPGVVDAQPDYAALLGAR
jgi:hypothetical protein